MGEEDSSLRTFEITFYHSKEGYQWLGAGNPQLVYPMILERISSFRSFDWGRLYISSLDPLFDIKDDLLHKLKGEQTEGGPKREVTATARGGQWIVARCGGRNEPDVAL
jgi:hypothetical protein